ncbi:MAG TPA: ImmA/IrrE family metallo-endopeptidase [Firmicutes bacterium]|nr:ImmA/IrrE family metallo-endopeptidase [Bacillota bacterium]
MEIKQRVNRLCRKYGTRDPFELAERMNILVVREPLGSINGYYNQCYRQKFIHINEELEEYRQKFTCAHELGHAVLHPKANTPFLRDNTLFSVSRLEREANCFAAELLCPDEVLLEYPGCTVGELARILGIREEALWACKGLG